MKRFVTLPLLICLTAPLVAHAADTYTVEPGHTSATFAFKHLGFSTFHGKFPKASGTVTLDQTGKKGIADITFDAASIVTGVPKLDEHLRSKDFFDVEKYPSITFKSQDFTFTGNTLSEVKGDL